jgi:hypothetical protein
MFVWNFFFVWGYTTENDGWLKNNLERYTEWHASWEKLSDIFDANFSAFFLSLPVRLKNNFEQSRIWSSGKNTNQKSCPETKNRLILEMWTVPVDPL